MNEWMEDMGLDPKQCSSFGLRAEMQTDSRSSLLVTCFYCRVRGMEVSNPLTWPPLRLRAKMHDDFLTQRKQKLQGAPLIPQQGARRNFVTSRFCVVKVRLLSGLHLWVFSAGQEIHRACSHTFLAGIFEWVTA